MTTVNVSPTVDVTIDFDDGSDSIYIELHALPKMGENIEMHNLRYKVSSITHSIHPKKYPMDETRHYILIHAERLYDGVQ